ncbi:uncharacterized protein MYCFIDRAFT_84193 [Pseudocercospora fijiensis CIRAD86]|uniref:Uncharacterized protein n=1 Tax=Pseudocercospora fijiensis (strain CIRAD86) TaxID=383855 RepID=N1Q8M6_PSEFD|nr:uncharacterized protein MYCFIDRAFT_84193 [Pseudocercospora fijiensis CIRAD86]EME87228.1 hypothetical protein MYCFIDRAFT_84193 [Pseudocercospora fijiensis CIRAD86]
MAPIRRYLRITKFSVLEVRVYLHKPSDTSWLLSSRDNVLQRIIAEVRPKVLPKLREENENAKKKSGKKKRGIKDVASQEDFEVAIFLKDTSTRHSLLSKSKSFTEKPRLKSRGVKNLTGYLSEDPINIDGDEEIPEVLREEGAEEVVSLHDIPEKMNGKRKSAAADGEDDALFVSSSDEEFFATQRANPKPAKRRKRNEVEPEPEVEEQDDDKKKMMMDTNYDGFSIYGRILCLIVTRKGRRDPGATTATAAVGGSQMMEQWIGTQAEGGNAILDDEEG